MKKFDNNWFQKNKQKIVTAAIVALILALYMGGIIAQSIDPYRLANKERIFFNPLYCIWANFSISMSGLLLMLFVYVIAGGYFFMRYRDKNQIETENDDRGFKRETSGVCGTSKIMTADDARDFCEIEPLERTTGLILGQFSKDEIISIPQDGKRFKHDNFGQLIPQKTNDGKVTFERERLKTNGNRHCVVTGASGSGKSFCYARPAIFQSIWQGESVIVTDPKGELFADTSEYAKERGYTVKIFNLMSPTNSDSWDALAELRSAPQIGIETQKFINTIVENTSNPNSSGDPMYENQEKSLLTAMALYILTAPSYTGSKTLGAVYDLLLRSEEELVSMFSELPEGNPALAPWSIFITGSEKLRGNIKSGASTRLQVLQEPVIKAITGIPDIDLTLPGKTKCIYYVIISDMDSTFKFISSLFFTCLFTKLVEYSRRLPNGKLPVSVNCIMDEFIAIGKLPDFDKKLATVRSAGINISMIFQTLAQLQSEYPNGLWETLIANCYSYLCLSCNDMTTAKYLSERSGLTTVALENLRVDRPLVDVANIPSTVSHTYSVGERSVLQPAEVIGLAGDNKIIISMLGSDLIIADKFPYTAMVNPAELKTVNMYEHAPAWSAQNPYETSEQYFAKKKDTHTSVNREEDPKQENKADAKKCSHSAQCTDTTSSSPVTQSESSDNSTIDKIRKMKEKLEKETHRKVTNCTDQKSQDAKQNF